MHVLSVLSLFTGIGAHDLGLERAGMKIVGQCEIEDYPTKVLEKHWPNVPRWRDVKSVTRGEIISRLGFIPSVCAFGFPCQDISNAGNRVGINGSRSGLFFEALRIVTECRFPWLIIENVPALRTRGADTVLPLLEERGYSCWPTVVGARHVGAPHKRDRVWIVAYLTKQGLEGSTGPLVQESVARSSSERDQIVADSAMRGRNAFEVSSGADVAVSDGNRHISPPAIEDPSCYKNRISETRSKVWQNVGNEIESECAPHRTGDDLADSNPLRESQSQGSEQEEREWSIDGGEAVVNADCSGRREQCGSITTPPEQSSPECSGNYQWPSRPRERQFDWEHRRTVSKSELGKSASGTAGRVARLKALGNCNPPQVVEVVGRAVIRLQKYIDSPSVTWK